MARLVFVFLDGVGLGSADAERNPFAVDRPGLRALAGSDWTEAAWLPAAETGRVTAALDAALGVPGRPQSATGQTTLLTGHNAASAMGRHYGPWPGPTLRALLARDSLFHVARTLGGSALANAYPAAYGEALRGADAGTVDAARRRRRVRASAPIVAAQAAGLSIADTAAFAAGRAVAADLDGRAFAAYAGLTALDPGLLGPDAQAGALARLSARRAFTFFDVWSSDRAGHAQDRDAARAFVVRLEAFLVALRRALGDDATLLVTSDHGNLEDLSTPRHTHARVPLLALGAHAAAFAGATSLVDVYRGVVQVLHAARTA